MLLTTIACFVYIISPSLWPLKSLGDTDCLRDKQKLGEYVVDSGASIVQLRISKNLGLASLTNATFGPYCR